MTRLAVSTDRAPVALGPYSQAIVAGGFVFCVKPVTEADRVRKRCGRAFRPGGVGC